MRDSKWIDYESLQHVMFPYHSTLFGYLFIMEQRTTNRVCRIASSKDRKPTGGHQKEVIRYSVLYTIDMNANAKSGF
jgi:hypothetical protein